MTQSISVSVHSTTDIVTARQRGRELASQLGFSPSEVTIIATVISEVARNIVEHANSGVVAIGLADGLRTGVQIVARDRGPGIPNPADVVKAGATGDELGLGLFGTRSLMDEFDLVSQVGLGTTVTMTKWLQCPARADVVDWAGPV